MTQIVADDGVDIGQLERLIALHDGFRGRAVLKSVDHQIQENSRPGHPVIPVLVLPQWNVQRLNRHGTPHFFFFSYFHTSGSPTTFKSSLTTSSLVLPSAWAWKLVLTRWRSTGMATFLMSSMATEKRPSMAATALPPWMRKMPARGPAPQSTILRTKSGADGSRGRVARTSFVTYSFT